MAIDFGKQIGPLPLGAWVAIVAGGLGIAWYTRQGGEGDPTAVEEPGIDTSGVPGVGDGSVGGWIPTQPTTPQNPDPAELPKPTTNEEWGQQVINGMIARNYSPTLVDSAVRKYLAAESLSASELTVIGLALTFYGSPPVPLPPAPNNPNPTTPIPTTPTPKPVTPKPKPPAPKPVTPAKKYRYYTVRRGDNLWNISKKYYGTGTRWGTIYNANRKGKRRSDGKTGMISRANLIHPGWVLLIP